MRIAILVQAHKNPAQIQRMLAPFRSFEEIDLYVNIDKKSPLEPFEKEIKNVHFIEDRVPIYWSNLSQVQGMLNSWKEILAKKNDYDYFIFMSGQDYLLKPVQELMTFLKENQGSEFIECEEISEEGLDWSVRYEKYHYTHLGSFRQTVGKAIRQLPFPRRSYPLFKKTYGGGAWVMLTQNTIEYLLKFCEEHPDFVSFHKYSHCPDEFFFQTILMNSPLRDKIINNNYWYIDWFNQTNNPKLLRSNHFDRIVNSNKFFARKFDINIDSKILDMIDEHRENPV